MGAGKLITSCCMIIINVIDGHQCGWWDDAPTGPTGWPPDAADGIILSMSSLVANAADSHCIHDAKWAIGSAALCEQWQGEEGAKRSRTSDWQHYVVWMMARGDGKVKHNRAKGGARSSARGFTQDQQERGSHITALLMIPKWWVEVCVKCTAAELC